MGKTSKTYIKNLVTKAVIEQPNWNKPFNDIGYKEYKSRSYRVILKKFTPTSIPISRIGRYWSWYGYVMPSGHHFVIAFYQKDDNKTPEIKVVIGNSHPDLIKQLRKYQYIEASLPYEMRITSTTHDIPKWERMRRTGGWW